MSPADAMPKRRRRLLLLALLVVAAAARLWKLDGTLFWVDEAESTINALTILEHGVPIDRYVGLPIYENTLIERTPDDPEYEFRDSSYSRRGLATYHGWLPLYAIAGALRIAGIAPDRPGALAPTRDDATILRMTVAARLPSVVAGLLLLLVLYRAARELAGEAAALAVTATAATTDVVIALSRDARYYSLTVLLGTLSCWLGWRLVTRRRWRDVAAVAAALALLFHCHVVTCVIACAVIGAALPFGRPRGRALAQLAVLACAVGAAALPFAFWSGFLEQAGAIPAAWPLLRFPEDLFRFLLERPAPVALLATGTLAAALAALPGERLPARLRAAFGPRATAFGWLAAWLAAGWFGFLALMPAVSNVFSRMVLPILGPGLLLAGLTVDGIVRLWRPRPPLLGAAALLLAFVFLATDARPLRSPRDEGLTRNVRSAIEWLRARPPDPLARFYATPNHHLTLQCYTGMAIQDVAPVRKEFLDRHPGSVILFEACGAYAPPSDAALDAAAERPLGERERARLRQSVLREAARRRLATMAAEVVVPAGHAPPPPPFEPVVAGIPAWTRESLARRDPVQWCPAVFRGFAHDDWTDWWRIYFFRFADPDARDGSRANYAERMRGARAEMLPYGWTVFVAPPRSAGG